MTDDVIKAEARELKVGRFVVIDNVPCRIVNIEISKPGKHGSAKMRVTAISLFDEQKKTLLVPTDATVEIPIVKKRTVQVLSIEGDIAHVMDKDTYETFDIAISSDLKNEVVEGKEIEVIESMGRRAITRLFKE